MSGYSVELTAAAIDAITAHSRYIADEAQSPSNARRWLERIWDAVDSLEHWPRRSGRAEEDGYVPYELRHLVVGSHLLLFTVDDERQAVTILGIRHGHRIPRPGDLPADDVLELVEGGSSEA